MRTQRIPHRRTQIIHFNHDTLSPRYRVPLVIARNGKLPACAASRARALPAGDAKEVLGGGGVETWVVEETAGGGVGVAIPGTERVAGAVGGEGGFVGLGQGEGGDGGEGEEE